MPLRRYLVALAAVTVGVCLLRVHDNCCRGARDNDECESNKGKKLGHSATPRTIVQRRNPPWGVLSFQANVR